MHTHLSKFGNLWLVVLKSKVCLFEVYLLYQSTPCKFQYDVYIGVYLFYTECNISSVVVQTKYLCDFFDISWP